MNKVFFYEADITVKIKHKAAIKQLIEFLFNTEAVPVKRINYIFCSDSYLLAINKKFLKHNTFTDVITFSLSKVNEPVFGEVYISLETVNENAKTYKTQYENELLRVMIHGALHLCNYSDKDELLKAKMRKRENFYLSKYNVPRESYK